jgi:hypothetical protein
LRDGSLNKEPECKTFVTQQKAICVSCAGSASANPVVSCSSGPTGPSNCQKLIVDAYICEVCHNAQGEIFSKKCAKEQPSQNCTSSTEGDLLCLVCTIEGKETFRDCQQQSMTCKSTTEGANICLECVSASGKSLSKQCAAASENCKAELITERLCLVCRDGAGAILRTICPK